MEGSRFDEWARHLVTRADRRRVLQGVSGLVAALLGVTSLEATEAIAKKKHKKKKKKKNKGGLSPGERYNVCLAVEIPYLCDPYCPGYLCDICISEMTSCCAQIYSSVEAYCLCIYQKGIGQCV